jgi:hypothetical protein
LKKCRQINSWNLKKKQPKFYKESEKTPIKIGFIIKKINLRNDKSHKKSVGIHIKGIS